PSRRIGSAISPPPQPTSRSVRPANGARVRTSRPKRSAARSRTKASRAGLKRCRGANGPSASHHSAAWAEKRATSAGSIEGPAARSSKSPALWGSRLFAVSVEAAMGRGMNPGGPPCKTERFATMTRPDATRLVMKFGGTSMGDLERIRRAARIVAAEVQAGRKVAVIVSAMAGKTNELVAWTDGAGRPAQGIALSDDEYD